MLADGHTPEVPVPTRALKVQGPELAELMLTGGKVIENRTQLRLGWWVVYVGKDRKWRDAAWSKPFKPIIDTVPTDEPLGAYYGKAVGMIFLSEYRTKAEHHGNRWAGEEPSKLLVELASKSNSIFPHEIRKSAGKQGQDSGNNICIFG